jgi:hypothetical protein
LTGQDELPLQNPLGWQLFSCCAPHLVSRLPQLGADLKFLN